MSRRRTLVLVAVVLSAVAAGAVAVTYAAFSGSTSNTGSSFGAKRVFPGTRSVSAWTVGDQSSGFFESNQTGQLPYVDGRTVTTGTWSTSFSSARYLEFDFAGPRPAGIAVSGVTFDFAMLPSTSTDQLCWYFEARTISTGAVLGTHGSAGSPLYCETGTAYVTRSVALPEITSTDQLNDLRVRVFARDATSARTSRVELATVSATMLSTATVTYPEVLRDAAGGGTPTVATWELVASDASNYQSASNWATSFSTSRFLRFTYDAMDIPAGAVISSVSFVHSYRSATTGTTAWYFEVYNGTTLLGTHGSSASPISTNGSTSTWRTDTVALPEVTAVAQANSLIVKIYMRNSGGGRSQQDLARLDVNWYLD